MYTMVQAGSMGLPFVPVLGLLGTDILKRRPDLLVMENPFNAGEEVVVARPIRPDVSVLLALRADRQGNAITPDHRNDLMLAQASRRVVVVAEEIVEGELTPRDTGSNTFLPAIDVDIVAHAPYGAHPCGCTGLYRRDDGHLKEYIRAAKEEDTFRAYLERYVYGVSSHQEYLERVGVGVAAVGGGD